MSTIDITIRLVSDSDIILLEKYFPEGGLEKHAERFSRQKRGDTAYLVAWFEEYPVGHALLKWGGTEDEHVAEKQQVDCPDVEDLFVLEEFRSKGIGRKLLSHVETLVMEKGYNWVGLSVAIANSHARRLYEHLGYHDAFFGEYTEGGEYYDMLGNPCEWEESCSYMMKNLGHI